jgi:hypothetical protein
MQCIRSLPYYRRSDLKTRLVISQECVHFFDQRFAYQISKILGEPLNGENLVMCLGGTADLAAQKGLKVGSYKQAELDGMNAATWKELTKY